MYFGHNHPFLYTLSGSGAGTWASGADQRPGSEEKPWNRSALVEPSSRGSLPFSLGFQFQLTSQWNNQLVATIFHWFIHSFKVPLEEQLDAEQLESLRKYEQRKQQRQNHTYAYTQVPHIVLDRPNAAYSVIWFVFCTSISSLLNFYISFEHDFCCYISLFPSLLAFLNVSYPLTSWQPQVSGPPTMVTFDPEIMRKEDIVEEQIDFSSARKQFLQGEATKKDVTPQIYSAKPFSKKGNQGNSDIGVETGESHVTWSYEGIAGEFTCERAVMTILREEDEGKSNFHTAFHPEESDSGLDELSVRSQDTTVFSLDNVSDSGASLPPTPLPLTPQPTTPVNGQTTSSPTEDELEYHAGVLVQNAIQNALAAQNGEDWQPSELNSSQLSTPVSPSSASTSSPVPVSSSPVSSGGAPSFQSPGPSSPAPSNPSPQPDRQSEVRVISQEKPLESQQALQQQQSSSLAQQPQVHTPSSPPSQPNSPPQRSKDGGPRIKIQSSYARALASSALAPASAPASAAPVTRPTPVYRPPSPPSPEKPEFGYFKKYSEAAELRSTAVAARGPEVEAASGPFRLRSKKQRTLSMIEEEIRAAQQREEELKKQREAQPVVTVRSSSSHGPARTSMRQAAISPADKMKSNSLPARLTLTARTTPGY